MTGALLFSSGSCNGESFNKVLVHLISYIIVECCHFAICRAVSTIVGHDVVKLLGVYSLLVS